MSTDEVERAAAAVVVSANRAAGVLEAYATTAARHATLARTQAIKVRDQGLTAARETYRARAVDVARVVHDAASHLAPGPRGARWDDPSMLAEAADVLAVAEHVRCGALAAPAGTGAGEIPLILPLLDHGNVRIVARQDRRSAADGAVQEILLRTLLGSGAGQVSLCTFDPRLSGTSALFSPLRQADEDVAPPALSAPEDLRLLLEGLARDVRRITDMYGGVPSTLGQFRRSTDQPIEHYQLVTLLDYPTGLDERLNELLLTLLRTGPACGISFVIHHDPDVAPADGVDTAAVSRATVPLDLDARSLPAAPGFQVRAGVTPPQAVVESALAVMSTRIRAAAAPRIDFLALQPPAQETWSLRSVDGITAVVGRVGHQAIEITLGDEIDQKHNVLVTGAVGQGKSNLLMALVHSWALRYSPDEIELYLLDFRDGVSLYPLASHGDNDDWLPHARVLGLESDRPFGLAVLEHLVGEFDRRARIIKPYGDNISRYRAERPDATMPRIVLVIDEFQVLFEEDDETTSAALLALDRLARRGRGYGIHLVLASQTVSGITALLAKQDGIFSQFPIRLALHNSAAESRAVLSPQNSEAARLRYRGELIVNRDFGEVEANQRGVVAFADPAQLRGARQALVRRSVGRPVPTVFRGSSPANLDEHPPVGGQDATHEALLGVVIGVEMVPLVLALDDLHGRHLSILGSGRRADGTAGSAPADSLHAAALSLARTSRAGVDRFVVLDLLGAADPARAAVTELVAQLAAEGFAVRAAAGAEVVGVLRELEDEIATRRAGPCDERMFVVGFGMDRLPPARVTDLATGSAPVDGLHGIWREGAPLGVHLLAWWSNARLYQDHVGLEAQGMIDAHMVFKVPTDAVVDLFGPFVAWSGTENRALVQDVRTDSAPRTVVPFGPAGGPS